MSAPSPDAPDAHVETPAEHIAAVQRKKNLYHRLTSSMPLLVTVIVHVVLIGIAAAVVVQQSGGAKKKTFEASNSENVADKQVEHRLQVARRGGSSGGSSNPVSANRIFSTAENALQMPAMPDLPSMGAGGFGGFSGMGSGVGLGAGTGMSTSLGGGTGLGGRGFMSLSFLGMTSQNASNVVFVVDIGPGLLDIRKGGFRAFEILRAELSRLVGALPLSAQFNVVIYATDQIRLFSPELQPANKAAKDRFFAWIKPINADLQSLGARSIPSSSPRWRADDTQNETLRLDPQYRPSLWINAVRCALEQKPDAIYLITASSGAGSREATQAELEAGRKRHIERVKNLVDAGYDLPAIAAARGRALNKLRADLNEINRQLLAAGKDPFVITDIRRALAADFQAAVRKSGHILKTDKTGWTDKNGNLMLDTPSSATIGPPQEAGWAGADLADLLNHVARLQAGILRDRASLNIFLFSGPDENNEQAQKDLSTLASRNGGKFSLLTTKRLEELSAQETP